ncbi:hypothetical protein R1flu_028129 [Riccia fluitans]|uniref:Uncharacterized protein n=1 Tax=Riccia fluitans TaxID=41844 RepID=A0ABD1XNN3_9MARC
MFQFAAAAFDGRSTHCFSLDPTCAIHCCGLQLLVVFKSWNLLLPPSIGDRIDGGCGFRHIGQRAKTAHGPKKKAPPHGEATSPATWQSKSASNLSNLYTKRTSYAWYYESRTVLGFSDIEAIHRENVLISTWAREQVRRLRAECERTVSLILF